MHLRNNKQLITFNEKKDYSDDEIIQFLQDNLPNRNNKIIIHFLEKLNRKLNALVLTTIIQELSIFQAIVKNKPELLPQIISHSTPAAIGEAFAQFQNNINALSIIFQSNKPQHFYPLIEMLDVNHMTAAMSDLIELDNSSIFNIFITKDEKLSCMILEKFDSDKLRESMDAETTTKRNLLHIAVLHKKSVRFMQILYEKLQEDLFLQLIIKKDIFGRMPLDFACKITKKFPAIDETFTDNPGAQYLLKFIPLHILKIISAQFINEKAGKHSLLWHLSVVNPGFYNALLYELRHKGTQNDFNIVFDNIHRLDERNAAYLYKTNEDFNQNEIKFAAFEYRPQSFIRRLIRKPYDKRESIVFQNAIHASENEVKELNQTFQLLNEWMPSEVAKLVMEYLPQLPQQIKNATSKPELKSKSGYLVTSYFELEKHFVLTEKQLKKTNGINPICLTIINYMASSMGAINITEGILDFYLKELKNKEQSAHLQWNLFRAPSRGNKIERESKKISQNRL